MGKPKNAAPQHGLQNPNKRSRNRSLSGSPSEARPPKKTLFEHDIRDWNRMMKDSAPRPEALPFTAVRDYINGCRSPSPLTDQIDGWLEDTYPSDIYHNYLYSDILIQNPLHRPQARYARSEPPSMGRRNVRGKRVRFSTRVSTIGSSSAGATPSGRNGVSTAAPGTTTPKLTGTLVENAQYEDINLAANNIIYRDRREELPEHILQLVEIISGDRELQDLSVEDVDDDDALADLERGAGEPHVEQYIQSTLVTLPPRNDILKRSDKIPMARWTVPNTGTAHRVSGPIPDILLGYNLKGAFTPAQRRSSSCVNIADMLNEELMERGPKDMEPIGNSVFSVSMNGTEARLCITWMEDETFYVQKIRTFALQEAQQLLEFRKCILNIMDYGRNVRLESIGSALDLLPEETLESVKSRSDLLSEEGLESIKSVLDLDLLSDEELEAQGMNVRRLRSRNILRP
ncbi:hypothetical protein FPSE_04848 [Fusarium pseudograminearum CS3096]|uniref:DUF7924 domain-containing protein n=1 Tax=Fusarium pseudograminearum (strain CS3096) TaxID=1028729 RepID=K3URC9_FUSPC|nr:hypothetical protein FPSE_04848 [Fusarium pseudograminearum CS3096]EKJ74956.1 hypothetical protein FPSE_04848 [Fusarium pseudograminearum CS3096]